MGPFNDTKGIQVKPIKKYYISFHGGGKRNINPYKFRCILGLYDDKELLGAAYFYRKKDEMPEQDFLYANGQIHIAYSEDHYGNIIDILRNELPCYIRYAPNWKMASINTSLEPVGEEETA